MIVLVKWTEHDRIYTIGLKEFFNKLDINVDDEKIKLTIKKLLEQQELREE